MNMIYKLVLDLINPWIKKFLNSISFWVNYFTFEIIYIFILNIDVEQIKYLVKLAF